MSGIETTPTPQDLSAYAGNASRYLLQNLPAELLVQIMKFLPDMAALSRLFTAYPTTITSFQESGNKIFASILANMSPELRNASLDVLAVRSRPPIHPSQITHFIEHHLDADAYDAQLRKGNYSLDALVDLIAVAGSLESLTESFAWQRVLGPSMQHSMPLSPVELHRIQRSLWRFQLCCDLCHPEDLKSSQESPNAQSRNTRRYIQHQTSHPTPPNVPMVPHWLHCRGEPYRPEALSRFLPNLCAWEHDELSAIRFHLLQLVNRIQYLRSCGAENQFNRHPLLLHRLIRDIDAWDPRNPTDHLLLASFAQGSAHGHGHGTQYPAVWTRRREMYAASVPNTARRFAIRAMQGGQEQWGWCVWDEERLVRRGLIDPVFEGLVEVERSGSGDMHDDNHDNHDDGYDGGVEEEGEEDDDEGEEERGPSKSKSQGKKRIQERGERVRRAHWECVGAQYEVIDWHIAAMFESYRRMWAERLGVRGG